MTSRFFRGDISFSDLAAATGLIPPPGVGDPPGQYNIAPTDFAPILRCADQTNYEGDYAPRGAVMLAPAFWGLVPAWWKKPLSEKKYSTINAPRDRLTTSKTFSGSLRHGRCLVPASGFYAWSGPKGASTPFAIGAADRPWVCFAGLWSRAMIDGSEFDTFTIITCPANDAVAGIVGHMPVILHADDHARWLDPAARAPLGILRPYPSTITRVWPADPSVGNVRNDGPGLVGGD